MTTKPAAPPEASRERRRTARAAMTAARAAPTADRTARGEAKAVGIAMAGRARRYRLGSAAVSRGSQPEPPVERVCRGVWVRSRSSAHSAKVSFTLLSVRRFHVPNHVGDK